MNKMRSRRIHEWICTLDCDDIRDLHYNFRQFQNDGNIVGTFLYSACQHLMELEEFQQFDLERMADAIMLELYMKLAIESSVVL